MTPAQLRSHVEVLASDAFEGRKPGTAGETKTIHYIAAELAARGLEPGAGNGSWFQPVPLEHVRAIGHRLLVKQGSTPIAFDQEDILLIGIQAVASLTDAPLWLVGRAGADEIRRTNLAGAVALLLSEAGPGRSEAREAALRQAGAAAVITILPEDMMWPGLRDAMRRGQDRLQRSDRFRIQGFIPSAAARRLVSSEQLEAASGNLFRPVRLPFQASLEVSTAIRTYVSYNVVGRLRGTGGTKETVLFLAHWDHLGICRPEGEPDRICNGAVDNASGIATLIEVSGRLGRARRGKRDMLFVATTAEEMGLLGAEHFAAQPVVPLRSIAASINVDTVAIHPAGEAVAVIGKGHAELDRLISVTATELGRRMDEDAEADAFVSRQDGWVLTRAGVPSVMIGGAFSDMKKLQAFLSGAYHQPGDDLKGELILEGAAEDADLLIALGRKLSDPKIYQLRSAGAHP